MRLPSIAAVIRRAGESAARFPLALASALVAAGGVIAAIEGPSRDWVPRLVATAVIGIPLFTATTTAAERLRARGAVRWAVEIALVLGLAGLFRLALDWPDRLAVLRFAQLIVAAHLLVAVLAYVRAGPIAGFWQFNRFLLLRFLIGGVYAAVLWIGLAVALAAVDKLLGIQVRSEAYPDLLALLAFAFHPWFVLAGVPDDYPALESLDDYPLGLKVFAQYVLIPLVSVYLAILTIYLGRVILTRTWPSGWIGWLVSSVSAAGMLALLLVHPARDRPDSRWVNGYGRWFFVALLPSLGMLLVAAGKRIGQYGVTEPRYFLVLLALWLVGLAVYFGATASRNIKLIPESLALIALLSAVGPWSAFAVSERSQVRRFRALLAANPASPDGGPVRAAMSYRDRREASAILRYLRSTHGMGALAGAVGVPRDSVLAWREAGDSEGFTAERAALERLGIAYTQPFASADAFFWLSTPARVPVDVTGYDRLYAFELTLDGVVPLEPDSLELRPGPDFRTLRLLREGETLITLDLGPAIDSAARRSRLGPGQSEQLGRPLVIDGGAGGLAVRVVIRSLNGRMPERRPEVTSVSGFLMLRRS